MHKLKILVTGVGAIIGHGIVRSLKKLPRDPTVIGLDLNPGAYGKFWCDEFYAKPSKEENDAYLHFLGQLIVEKKIDLILPGIEQDVYFLNEHREYFKDKSVPIALNKKELITASKDKYNIYSMLYENGFDKIPTKTAGSWQECKQALGRPPFILKPRRGSGSQGIFIINNKDDFIYWKKKYGRNFMIQKIVGDDNEEYTVGVFGLGNGESFPPIVFRRKLSTEGSTQFAEVVLDKRMALMVKELNRFFLPVGPTNYQFRRDGEKIYLLEINPRISSSTSLRTAFGYNESEMCIDYFLHQKPPQEPHVVQGSAFRYFEDYVIML